jgi:hypothetical protein
MRPAASLQYTLPLPLLHSVNLEVRRVKVLKTAFLLVLVVEVGAACPLPHNHLREVARTKAALAEAPAAESVITTELLLAVVVARLRVDKAVAELAELRKAQQERRGLLVVLAVVVVAGAILQMLVPVVLAAWLLGAVAVAARPTVLTLVPVVLVVPVSAASTLGKVTT